MNDGALLEVVTLQEQTDDRSCDFIPKILDDYIGQEELKKKLEIYTCAANMRKEALDHTLLFGPPGLGKTTLATIIAHTMKVNIRICTGPMLERAGDLVAILSSLEERDVLFIDEIHRLPTVVEEVLYSAMEQFRIDVIIGQGAGAKSVNLPLAPFTLVGATTKSGMISAPLRSRFGIIERLDFYTPEQLALIVVQAAQFLEMSIDQAAALAIAVVARGTPRIAKKLLRRVRDFAQVEQKVVNQEFVLATFDRLGIDRQGLTQLDRTLLQTLLTHFKGGPVGLETLASMIGEDANTLELVYEPFLMRLGYLERTPRGRQIPPHKIALLQQRFIGQQTLCDDGVL
jgi:holliday junction DNA helicase RuvB